MRKTEIGKVLALQSFFLATRWFRFRTLLLSRKKFLIERDFGWTTRHNIEYNKCAIRITNCRVHDAIQRQLGYICMGSFFNEW